MKTHAREKLTKKCRMVRRKVVAGRVGRLSAREMRLSNRARESRTGGRDAFDANTALVFGARWADEWMRVESRRGCGDGWALARATTCLGSALWRV